ncbi:MAG: O-acetyl-ADP-ribose deacetylase [Candidatus Thermoplasmatota archaeon]
MVRDEITKQDTDAVVNAANKKLAPGGGVAGAIHQTAGKKLWEECKKLGGCKTGEAKITKAYNLPSKYVIHTVGPIYSKKKEDNSEYLSSCYRNSLDLANNKGIKSVSFPAISTGAFGYPIEEAAEIAIKTIINWLKNNAEKNVELVRLVLYSQEDFDIHKKTAEKQKIL